MRLSMRLSLRVRLHVRLRVRLRRVHKADFTGFYAAWSSRKVCYEWMNRIFSTFVYI